MSVKTERIASQIVQEISYILAYEIKDSDIKFVTVTDCKLASDLSYAKIYVTCLDNNKRDSIIKDLNNASKFIRKELASRIDVRHTPELTFTYDESIDYGKKIEDIIEQINEDK